MEESVINIFGYIGSFLVSINLIPQIVKIIKNKSGNNVSFLTLLINIFASIFMLLYGFYKLLYPVIISNSLIFVSSFIILYFKNFYSLENSNNQIKLEQIYDINFDIDIENQHQ